MITTGFGIPTLKLFALISRFSEFKIVYHNEVRAIAAKVKK